MLVPCLVQLMSLTQSLIVIQAHLFDLGEDLVFRVSVLGSI